MQVNGANVLKLTTGAATMALALTACSTGSPVASLGDAAPGAKGTPAMLVEQSDQARIKGNAEAAISFAELAVTADPQSFDARVALAKAYLAAGRFQSASEAYGDMAAMRPEDNGARFRMALTELAKGNRRTALSMLDGLVGVKGLEPDVGLALALAGDADRAVGLLEATIRNGDSTVRVRQNLALAQALAGDWAAAKVTASVDLAPNEVDARMTEWAALASNKDSSFRTASMLGVTPAELDNGRPVQLAWAPPSESIQMAAADPAPAMPVEVAAAQPAPAAPVEAVAVAPVDVAATSLPASRAEPVAIARTEVPAAIRAPEPWSPTVKPVNTASPAFATRPMVAVKRDIKALPRQTAGTWVVQVGAYSKGEFVQMGWKGLVSKNKSLSDFAPIKSSIELNGTKYHRLAVGSFASVADAVELCQSLKSSGQECFVRRGEGGVMSSEPPSQA